MVRKSPEADRCWTIPNVISFARLLGVFPLLWAAHENHRDLFLWIMIALLLSDWLDGMLAKVLDQRTVLGARLDSGVDAFMYAAIALSLFWLEGEVIRSQMGWLLAVLGSWTVSMVVGFYRFRRLPSYHMWSAKVAWLVAACTALVLLLTGSSFLVPWALGLAVLANLHAVAVSLTLPRWEADIWSLRQARLRRQESG